jgi:hypothetical protein
MRRARERGGRGVRGWRSGGAVKVCAKASLLRRGRVSVALGIGRIFGLNRGEADGSGFWKKG